MARTTPAPAYFDGFINPGLQVPKEYETKEDHKRQVFQIRIYEDMVAEQRAVRERLHRILDECLNVEAECAEPLSTTPQKQLRTIVDQS